MVCLLKRKPGDRSSRYNTEHPCYANQCARCGWNSTEHERRLERGLTRGSDGLKHFTVSPPTIKTEESDTNDSTETP